MAHPEVNDGHLKIADGLVGALAMSNFSSIEQRVILAVMVLTYRVGKTKAAISSHDISCITKVKLYRVENALTQLLTKNVLFLQETVDGGQLLGIQKDYEKWVVLPNMRLQRVNPATLAPKLPSTYVVDINTNLLVTTSAQNWGNTDITKLKSFDPVLHLLDYVQETLDVTYNVSTWRVERSKGRKLYTLALEKHRDGKVAIESVKDHLDFLLLQPTFRAKVTMPVSYMLKSYPQWAQQIPPKPTSVRDDEDFSGYRYTFDLTQRRWNESHHKIGGHRRWLPTPVKTDTSSLTA